MSLEPSSDAPPPVLSSVHTHSRYCDGHGQIEEYAQAAHDAGLAAFGASGHAPLPFDCEYAIPLSALDAYRTHVREVAAGFEHRVPVLLGLELDYLPGLDAFYEREFLGRGFDYFIASVHYVGEGDAEPWTYDESEESFRRQVELRYDGDARPVVEDYYQRVCRMAEEVASWPVPIIVGHLDRIVLWNRDDRYFATDSTWYSSLVEEALSSIQRAGLIVELNTSGWAKPVAQPNPNAAIIQHCVRRGIPLIVSADAHYPDRVAFRFREALDLLASAGARELVVPRRNGWTRSPLPPGPLGEATQ